MYSIFAYVNSHNSVCYIMLAYSYHITALFTEGMHLQNMSCRKAFLRSDLFAAVRRLCAAWLPGLLIGCTVGVSTGAAFAPYLRAAYITRVSFVGSLFALLIPLLLSVVMERCFNYSFVLPVAFVKAFLFSVSVTACILASGSAGWLICRLLLFSDFLSILVLLWFWFRTLHKKQISKQELLMACICILFVGMLDYFVISPYLVSLFHF